MEVFSGKVVDGKLVDFDATKITTSIDLRNVRGAIAIAESEICFQLNEQVAASFQQIATMLNEFVDGIENVKH